MQRARSPAASQGGNNTCQPGDDNWKEGGRERGRERRAQRQPETGRIYHRKTFQRCRNGWIPAEGVCRRTSNRRLAAVQLMLGSQHTAGPPDQVSQVTTAIGSLLRTLPGAV